MLRKRRPEDREQGNICIKWVARRPRRQQQRAKTGNTCRENDDGPGLYLLLTTTGWAVVLYGTSTKRMLEARPGTARRDVQRVRHGMGQQTRKRIASRRRWPPPTARRTSCAHRRTLSDSTCYPRNTGTSAGTHRRAWLARAQTGAAEARRRGTGVRRASGGARRWTAASGGWGVAGTGRLLAGEPVSKGWVYEESRRLRLEDGAGLSLAGSACCA